MGRIFLITLEGNIYCCKYCQTHLALEEDIVSKSFRGKTGMAYLFNKVVNVTVGEKEERMMITGMHTVVDVFCVGCGSRVGWKYEAAKENSQKYKEGKFVIEMFQVLSPSGSTDTVKPEDQTAAAGGDDASLVRSILSRLSLMEATLSRIEANQTQLMEETRGQIGEMTQRLDTFDGYFEELLCPPQP